MIEMAESMPVARLRHGTVALQGPRRPRGGNAGPRSRRPPRAPSAPRWRPSPREPGSAFATATCARCARGGWPCAMSWRACRTPRAPRCAASGFALEPRGARNNAVPRHGRAALGGCPGGVHQRLRIRPRGLRGRDRLVHAVARFQPGPGPTSAAPTGRALAELEQAVGRSLDGAE